MTYKYRLEPYRQGGSTKYQCPACGRRKCFTRYISLDTMCYIDDTVGKCDHLNSCGYHLTPRDFFLQHPDHTAYKPSLTPKDASGRLLERNIVQTDFIPASLVEKSHQPISTFAHWLRTKIADEALYQQAFDDYRLGAMRDGRVIFWYIDSLGRVHDGKMMAYEADGHRSKNLYPNFVGTKFQGFYGIAPNYRDQRTWCLFGEHLLARYPDKPVSIVESEKTAVVCSAKFPFNVWLATGGCSMLNASLFRPLLTRKVTFWPDSGCYDKWRSIIQRSDLQGYTISTMLESYPSNTDLADIV